MSTIHRTRALLAFLALAAPASALQDPPRESWADPGLPVTRGLALWLDADRLNAARDAHGQPPVSDGDRVDRWYDASGRRRHLDQPRDEARPAYRAGALRFDGESSSLERADATLPTGDFTLFVAAAPFSNGGGFRGLVAMNKQGRDDFTTGFTVDLGYGYTPRFEALNVEGKGFGGMADLMTDSADFGLVRRLTVTSTPGPAGTALRVDGRPAGTRNRDAVAFEADRLVVGARHYGFPPAVRGSFDGDILHVLLYDRALDDSEIAAVESYLDARLGGPGPIARPGRPTVGKPLIAVADPPAVQILAPGFAARELPVKLNNVNNLKYRHDGKLVALTYGGDVYLLSDADGDGLEETASVFFEGKGSLIAPIGMAIAPGSHPAGDGVFVASKGKVSLIADRNRDGRADEEIVVAQGWTPLPHGVDALGVAIGPGGEIYFGLGTTDFTNAYVLGKDGRAGYRLNDEHGTIQRVAPDLRTREIVATGIRFPVALAFNRHGDLFATDQEGATWLPNGNPFDELLHVRQGRHYGFPPRHPKHLPSVIDEPSVFDYTPQHQSTCGLNFNESVYGGPTFGPPSWAGDALVTGYSRGKLFRTVLARTPVGYVARNHVLAVLTMLPADACVSPRGDLVVAAHSGLPDWGSGPAGAGKLYQIRLADPDAPQPVIAWAAGPQEVRVAFDRPLDPNRLRDLARSVAIDHGPAVGPGDRFESQRPGYEVVGRQLSAPRFDLPILSAQLTGDRRTLLLSTAPHPEATSYAITLPGLGRPDAPAQPGTIRQVEAVDLAYDLAGVEARWEPVDGNDPWTGWLPHVDLAVARAFTAGSAEHDRLWAAIDRPGRLTLKTRLDLRQMLRPAVQPGSTTGYTLPPEEVSLRIAGASPVGVTTPADVAPAESDGPHAVRVAVPPGQGDPLPIEITLTTGGPPSLAITFATAEDDRPRALPLRRFLLPWAILDRRAEPSGRREVPELAGGDWARGRALFFGEPAKCSACHAVRGRGGSIGPDLSNLVHRDYASVLRDVHAPSAAINPDYLAHAVALADGRVLTGTLRTEGDRLIVGDADGRLTAVDRAEVEQSAPSSASIMPEGLDVALGADRLRDLLTFLLTDPLAPAIGDDEGAPPARRRAELDALLAGSAPVADPRPLKVVLSSGPKDHGPGEHDYPLWRKRWSALLATDPTLAVETADGWPAPAQLETADLIVVYSSNPGWDASKAEGLDRFLARGGGLVLIHYAVEGHRAVAEYADRIGLAWQGGKSRYRHGPLDLDFGGSDHPVARNFAKLHLVDESYWELVGDPTSIDLIASAPEEGRPQPLVWARQVGPGRVFVSIPGHYTWTFDDPLFRVLLLRGMSWAAGQPVDRLNELATPGARIVD